MKERLSSSLPASVGSRFKGLDCPLTFNILINFREATAESVLTYCCTVLCQLHRKGQKVPAAGVEEGRKSDRSNTATTHM